MSTHEPPSLTLPRDEFSSALRDLDRHPEAVTAQTRIDVADDYGNMTTWNIDLYRIEGKVTALVQTIGPGSTPARFVIPPAVTSAIARHQAGLVSKARSKAGKRIAANKKALGLPVGNPDALAQARKARRLERRKK